MPTIAQALVLARDAGIDRLDAQRLLAHRLRRPRAWLIAHDESLLPPDVEAAWHDDLARLADEVPLAQLLGEQEFHGLTLRIGTDVLVPRADTEALVGWAIERLAGHAGHAAPEVIDLGTGSGAIALALAHACPAARLTATDASAAALALAGENAQRLGLALDLAAGSWWQAVPGRRFDLVVSNPPYIAADDPHLRALRHEPALALTPGGDGLDAIRAITAGAPQHLRPGGWLLLEHGWDQADAVRELLHAVGLTEVDSRRDLGGRWRCSGGRRS